MSEQQTESTEPSSSLPAKEEAAKAPSVDAEAIKAQAEARIREVEERAEKRIKEISEKAPEEAINKIVNALRPQEKQAHATHKQFVTDPDAWVNSIVEKATSTIEQKQQAAKDFEDQFAKATSPFLEEVPELSKYAPEYRQAMINEAAKDSNADLATIAKRAAEYCTDRYNLKKLSEAERKARMASITMTGDSAPSSSASRKSSNESFLELERKRAMAPRGLVFTK